MNKTERLIDAQFDLINGLLSSLPAEILKKVVTAMNRSVVETQLRERKLIRYTLESDMADNEGIYSLDYLKCMTDEIANHNEFIEQYEYELSMIS